MHILCRHLVLAFILLFPVRLVGQPRPSTAELPVKQVVLFSSGVGYYQREGQVEGQSRIDLQFHVSNINDLLKSLVLEDRNGGQISTINYDNRNPIEMTLKSFAIDLTQNPSMGDLLNQARGEQVEVQTTVDSRTNVGQTETIAGLIVGVEKQRQPIGQNQFVEVSQLNILTREGLRGVPLSQVQRVRFMKQALEQEFRKALEVLATGHDKQKKTVSLNFSGQGKRSVKVGYVTESPIWKTSYRLSLDRDKLFMQGWAIVENTTDEDWNSVDLRLVSGRPISFQMDLYQPLFVRRPTVELELFASLRPQMYAGDLGRLAERPAPKMDAKPTMMPAAPATAAPEPAFGGRGGRPAVTELLRKSAEKDKAGIDFHQGAASAAVATELGEYFQYLIAQPVNLPRQKSALIPILNEGLTGSKRVSIYNEAIQSKFPLLGLQFKNSTPLHLCQGPITLFENNSYAGDAQIGNVQPGETRLISYAIDLGTEVEAKQKETDDLVKVALVKGLIHTQTARRESKTYTIKNRAEHTRQVLIEHPYRSDFQLLMPKKPAERSRDMYRFEVEAAPNKPAELTVVEEQVRTVAIMLGNKDDENMLVLIRSKAASDKVKSAMKDAFQLKEKVVQTRRDVQREEQAVKVIEQDQSRMRANMERVPQTSEAYRRYLKKFDEQETDIEKRRAKIVELQAKADQETKALESFLANLTVE